MPGHLLAIDQGTTSSRAIVFDTALRVLGVGQQEFSQHYPAAGWVEHEPEDIWRTVVETSRTALAAAGVSARDIAGIGITNQRETTIVWDRATGRALHRAIVWQDRRTADRCADLERQGAGRVVEERTGLRLDPYFSGTKLAWLLDADPSVRARAERGEVLFGTVDSFLIWRLTGGRVHATDATNASRTLLYDIHRGCWDDDLLRLFGVPRAMLPDVRDCAADYGTTAQDVLGAAIPIRGVAGDQQAATIGQACFEPGMVKCTFGTGAFALMTTGEQAVRSANRLITTVACQFGGRRTYALEGSIFIAGAAVQWLRDGLRLITSADQTGPMAAAADETQDVILVPAFVGLGAPHWAPDARGALYGLTRATGPNDLARAALESVCFQTVDLLEAMRRDCAGLAGAGETVLRVDGGMVASDWTMQRLADLIDAPVDRPVVLETTALGAGYLAGLGAGLCPPPAEFARTWSRERRFTPTLETTERARKIALWRDAVRRTLG